LLNTINKTTAAIKNLPVNSWSACF
jgi:hypothetical protein